MPIIKTVAETEYEVNATRNVYRSDSAGAFINFLNADKWFWNDVVAVHLGTASAGKRSMSKRTILLN
jgi:hypothetical protein